MTKKCIDYRNGGMGNTILAHVLYASNQIDLSLADFFSPEGNAHRISHINQTNLTARHLIEFPDESVECVLQIISKDWTEILRWKMSYSKWWKYEPNLINWHIFFEHHHTLDLKNLWEDFYQKIRDPCWPQCDFDHRDNLPKLIIEEIDQTFVDPRIDIKTELNLLEFLTTIYYDQLSQAVQHKFDVPILLIDQYLHYDISKCVQLASYMGWTWDELKSSGFHIAMLNANRIYFDWLDIIKENYHLTLQKNMLNKTFRTWELATLIAKICQDLDKNPKNILWEEHTRVLSNSNVKLYELIGI
jgi:hypothetical protein